MKKGDTTGNAADKPFPGTDLECVNEWARGVERGLRHEIYLFDELEDDHVLEPAVNVNWRVAQSDYGVEVKMYTDPQPGPRVGFAVVGPVFHG
jgi:hypothetical protein